MKRILKYILNAIFAAFGIFLVANLLIVLGLLFYVSVDKYGLSATLIGLGAILSKILAGLIVIGSIAGLLVWVNWEDE
jgi:Ni,Fe-hydrogenase I cytochrome b subunit